MTLITRHKETLYLLLFFILGSFLTFLTTKFFSVHPVLSSSLIGLLFSFLISRKMEEKGALLALYSGTFIGMSSAARVSNLMFLFLASVFALVLFKLSKRHFNGIGGKLGTIAFISVTLIVALQELL